MIRLTVTKQIDTRALNRHQISHKPIGEAASPTLNRLVNHKATESTVLLKGAEQ